DEALVLAFGVTDIVSVCHDQDGDGVCDADEPPTTTTQAPTTTSTTTTLRPTTTTQAPTTTMTRTGAAVARAKLMLGKLAPPAGDDTLAFEGEMRIPTSPAVDPVATGARVIVGEVVDLTIPGGAGRCSVSAGVSRCRERAQCPTEKKWSFRGVAVRTARWRSTNCAGARGMRSWRS